MPAYLALERWVLARTVVVVQPSGPEGPRRLVVAGARRVLVIGADFPSEPGIEVRPATGARLPLRDDSVDVVLCIEAFGGLRSTDRRELLREGHRVLRGDGMFCAWIEQRESEAFGRTLAGSSQIDFWGLEDQIGAVFPRVDMLAQMPWQGFSLAPILDDEGGGEEPQLALREDLLDQAPEASHYLAVASKTRTPSGLARECLLIPLPRADVFQADPQAERDSAEIEELRDELDRLREELSLRAAKVAAAHGRVRELEGQLDSIRTRSHEVEVAELDRLRDALTEVETQLSIFRAREQEQGAQIARLDEARSQLEASLLVARHEQTTRGANVATIEAELRQELEAARVRARELEDRLRSHETDLQILTRTSTEQDKTVERLTSALDNERRTLEQGRVDEKQLRGRIEALDSEREELRRQNEVYVAEREGARKLAQRMEAELEVAGRRAREHEQALSSKIEEASRLAGELEAMRKRVDEAEKALAQIRSRAEELSATAAQGAEQGRMLADVALDRDRLREELSQRGRALEQLEAKVWEHREALQKERLDGVRVSGEVERLREQVERSRAEEQKRTREVEQLGRELRALEIGKAEATALLRMRDEQLARFEREAEALAGQSGDLGQLRTELRERNSAIANLADQLAAIQARDERADAQAKQTEAALVLANERIAKLVADLDHTVAIAAKAEDELDVKRLEIEQLHGTVAGLQAQLEDARDHTKQREHEKAELQRQLEEAAAARDSLRRQLRERESEIDRLNAESDAHAVELQQLRRDVEAATARAERLELAAQPEPVEPTPAATSTATTDQAEAYPGGPTVEQLASWPEPARVEIERLRAALADQARESARELTAVRAEAASVPPPVAATPSETQRLRKLKLEIQVRVAEQEYMLAQLDSAEQRIWEMTDASDRNAARFAASLAQLEKHKETVDALLDELEVTRNLLAAEQARALEQERTLASERAKMARAGIGVDGFPASDTSHDPFADLENRELLDLGTLEPAAKPEPARRPPPPQPPIGLIEPGKPVDPPKLHPTAQELDHRLASLTDDDEDDESTGVTKPVAKPVLEPGVPTVIDPSQSKTIKIDRGPSRARMTIEAVEDDEWED